MKKTLFVSVMLVSVGLFAQLTYTSVSIPMRDGKTLAADVYVPNHCNDCPTILIQTPYNKNSFRASLPLGFRQDLESSPYSWVIVDWRGFYGSSAAAVAQADRGEDGYDVIDWIVAQSWNNGKVGTWGPSALGNIQYQTAQKQHPNHTCAVPQVSDPKQAYESYFYGGVLFEARLLTLDALGYGLSTTIYNNPYHSAIWTFSENNSWFPQDINIPMLNIGGWYDHNVDGNFAWYEGLRTQGGALNRDNQWLLIGPWVHGGTGAAYVGSANQGELTYQNAEFVSDQMALEFFEYYLQGIQNGWETTSKITYYELGTNEWASSNGYSIVNTQESSLYLSENGMLNTTNGVGTSVFISDPRNPSPTIGGATLSTEIDQGPYDQSSLDGRGDVLTFETEPLSQDIHVTGKVKLKVYVSTDVLDADIAVRLTDEYPDGRSMLINDGIQRMRFLSGYTQANETLLTPGNVYEVTVELPIIDYTWLAGHKVKVYVSGNCGPKYNVNIQDGGPMYASGDTTTANITIHHDATRTSELILPGDIGTLGTLEKTSQEYIFPNPTNGDWLYLPEGIESVRITNLSGQQMTSGVITSNKLDITGLPKGTFIITLFRKNGTELIQRFVRQ